jgi:hypothetical protein
MVKHNKLHGEVSGETRDGIPATTLGRCTRKLARPSQIRAILMRNCSGAGILARYAASQPNEPPSLRIEP